MTEVVHYRGVRYARVVTRGPRGGRIIGKTKSGKPIYAHRAAWPDEHRAQLHAAIAHATTHHDFTAADHADAAALERQRAAAVPAGPRRDKHSFLAHGHTAVGAYKTTGNMVHPADIAAALDFSTSLGHTGERHQLRYRGLTTQHPQDVPVPLERLKPQGSRGWLRKYPPTEWASRMTHHTGRDYQQIVTQYRSGKHPPAIALDGKIYDGLGRAALYHALGRRLPVVHFARS
jgi:hypothetical protein